MRFCYFFAICILLVSIGCTSDVTETGFGIQTDHASFVPARISVLHCRQWPAGSRFKTLPLTNFSAEELTELCKKFDEFVLRGFEGQPYMRGISPSAVKRAIDTAKGEKFLDRIDELWQHKSDDCQDCPVAPSFYVNSLAGRPEWRLWLTELSRGTKNADAVLIPMITYGYSKTYNDRGIRVAQKAAGLVLMLVDTNNGYLLWAGGRKAEASNQILIDKPSTPDPKSPEWIQLYDRLFTDEIWQDFPGRQVYH